jgi:CheY-like chemotaxis protein
MIDRHPGCVQGQLRHSLCHRTLSKLPGREDWITNMNAENPLSILVVDDDEVLGRILARVLQQQGHAVRRAESAAEALALARDRTPHLVLVDLCLPVTDGVELARQLRKEHPGIHLILMTAYPLRLRDQPRLAKEFNQVLTKPLDLADLRQAVDSTLALCG